MGGDKALAVFDRLHTALLLVAFGIAICFLFLRPDNTSNDFNGHVAYLNHLQLQPLDPFSYTGRESWHPPTYYYLAAFAEEIGSRIGLSPLKGARVFSVVLFVLYIHFALRTFRLLFDGRTLWCASVLFIVWPSNYEMSTRLNSDVVLFPVYAAVQFYLLRSVLLGDIQDSLRALCISFGGLLFKTSALVPVAEACLVTAGMCIVLLRRDPHKLKGVLSRWGPTLLLTIVVSVCVNCSRPIVYKLYGIDRPVSHLGGKKSQPLSLTSLAAFRPWRVWENPFSDFNFTRCTAVEFAFKTALFTEQHSLGKGKFLGRMWIVLVFFQLLVAGIYLARRIPVCARRGIGWVRGATISRRSSECSERMPVEMEGRGTNDAELLRCGMLVVLALFPVMAILVFAWKQNLTVCSNYRFVQASLVAWVGLLFMPAYNFMGKHGTQSIGERVAWYGGFTLMTWGIVCVLLKIFHPILGWN